MRLADGSESHLGRVEVYYNGEWGTVCDDDWGLEDAGVVCRQLGFTDAIRAVWGSYFGEGTGPVLLDEVACSGSEDRLVDCPHAGWGVQNCAHGEDAGVVCQPQEGKGFHFARSIFLARAE